MNEGNHSNETFEIVTLLSIIIIKSRRKKSNHLYGTRKITHLISITLFLSFNLYFLDANKIKKQTTFKTLRALFFFLIGLKQYVRGIIHKVDMTENFKYRISSYV